MSRRLIAALASLAVVSLISVASVVSTGPATAMTPPPPDAIEGCGLPSIWSGPVAGGPLAGRAATTIVHPGHAWSTVVDTIAISSTWAVRKGELVLTDLSSVPAPVACNPGQEGVYAVDFVPDCTSFTMKAVSDPCPGRHATLNGITLKRTPPAR